MTCLYICYKKKPSTVHISFLALNYIFVIKSKIKKVTALSQYYHIQLKSIPKVGVVILICQYQHFFKPIVVFLIVSNDTDKAIPFFSTIIP